MMMMADKLKLLTLFFVAMATAVRLADAHSNSTDKKDSSLVDEETEAGSSGYLRHLFNKYGRGGVMTFEGLEHFLANLGLGRAASFGHALQSHVNDDGHFVEFHDDHIHHPTNTKDNHEDEIEHNHSHDHSHDSQDNSYDSHDHDKHGGSHEPEPRQGNVVFSSNKTGTIQGRQGMDNKTNSRGVLIPDVEEHKGVKRNKTTEKSVSCLSAQEIWRTFHVHSDGMDTTEFLLLCPALVYQLDQHVCHSRKQHTKGHHLHAGSSADDDDGRSEEMKKTAFHLNPWFGAFAAVGVISLAGFLVVALIPAIANCAFYHHLVQFLISLAVGTLTADALLHLLPHAMIPHNDQKHSHSQLEEENHGTAGHQEGGHDKHPVWVGLVAFGAILFFFVLERVLRISSDFKSHKKRKQEMSEERHMKASIGEDKKTKVEYLANPTEMVHLKSEIETGFPQVKNKTKTDSFSHPDVKTSNVVALKEVKPLYHDDHYLHDNHQHHPGDAIDPLHDDHHHHHHHHEADHHHHHGHSHEVPNSIASVAWMVIMGDGLHNFTDGLAIGASFSNGLPIGLSTTVAVLCHELPHELGDFAVLLKSGMSMKQALICNLLSSVLCFMGTAMGVALGNIESITAWVFSVTAGIFIYIALVDMLPQITSSYGIEEKPPNPDVDFNSDIGADESVQPRSTAVATSSKRLFGKMKNTKRLLLHVSGMSLGLSLMLLIAVYEDQIKIFID